MEKAKQTKPLGVLIAELGQTMYSVGRYEDAKQTLNRALEEELSDADRAQVYLTLGRTQAALDKTADAVESFGKAAKLDPSTFDAAMVELNAVLGKEDWVPPVVLRVLNRAFGSAVETAREMGFKAVEQGDFARAEAALRLIVRVQPDEVEAWEKLGLSYAEQGKSEESLAAYNQAITRAPQRASARCGLGQVYNQLERYPDAIDVFDHALTLDAKNADALLGRGVARRELASSMQDGKRILLLEDSEEDLQQAVALQPRPASYRELVATQLARGKTEAAVSTCVEASRLLLTRKDSAGALYLAEKAVNLDAKSVPAQVQLGRALRAHGRWREALLVLQGSMALEATAEAYTELARLHDACDEPDRALEAADAALSLSPDSSEAMLVKGMLLRRLGRPKEALEVLEEVLSRDKELSTAQGEVGRVLEDLGRPEDALDAYERAVQAAPEYGLPYGLLLLQQDRNKDARDVLDRAQELFPKDPEIHAARGRALYNLKEYREAVAAFDTALNLNPSDPDACRLRGFSLRLLGRNEEAVEALQLAIDFDKAEGNKEDARTYAERGDALRSLGRYRESATAFKRAIILRENYQWALSRYGETLRVLGENEMAVKMLEQATGLDPQDSFAWASLGASHTAMEQYVSAQKAFNRALDISPNYAWAWGYRGIMYRLSGLLDRAVDAFDKALALSSAEVWVLVEKGIALRLRASRRDDEQGWKQAIDAFERAIQLSPENSWAMAQVATCYYNVGRLAEAMDTASKALALDSSLAWLSTLKSLIFEKQGQYSQADKFDQESLTDPPDSQAYVSRGGLYAQIGAYDRAKRDYKKALELDPGNPSPYNSLAWLYVEYLDTNLEEATQLAEKGVDLAREKGDKDTLGMILDTQAWAYYKRGMAGKAVPLLEEAAKLCPENLEVAAHLETCRSAS